MGVVANVGYEQFPSQSGLKKRVKVCFNYDNSKQIGGEIVRCDTEEPGVMIIKLDDGRFVLATECQYGWE